MIQLFTVSLTAYPKKQQQKNRTNTHFRKKVQLSETLQHRETDDVMDRGNNYDQCSLRLHIAKTDKQNSPLAVVIMFIMYKTLN